MYCKKCDFFAMEVIGLNLDEVDYKTSTARVLGKGNKERVVPVGKTAMRFLESYVKGVRPYFVKQHSDNAMFLNMRGIRIKYKSILHTVRKHAEKLNLDVDVACHTFRRSCATELIRNEANLYHVKELLGHESLGTMKHYVKLTILDLKTTHSKCHPREKDR